MKFSLVASIAILAGIAVAQVQLEERAVSPKCAKIEKKIPACAVPCIAAAAKKEGCAPKNFACQCKKETAIAEAAEKCVLAKCTIAQAETAEKEGEAFCKCFEAM